MKNHKHFLLQDKIKVKLDCFMKLFHKNGFQNLFCRMSYTYYDKSSLESIIK